MGEQNNSDSGRIFQSELLEKLTKTHIAIPLTIFYGSGVAATVYAVMNTDVLAWVAVPLFLLGAFFFTLVEYSVHRWFYHMATDSPRKARIQYVFHGVHHDHPRDKKRLALPPIMSVLVAAMFIGLFRLLMGTHGFVFGGGFMAGYATYLLAHYAIHVRKPPKNWLGVVWKHHNLHHYVGDDGAFGVSSPFWYHVFGSMPPDPRRRAAAKVDLI